MGLKSRSGKLTKLLHSRGAELVNTRPFTNEGNLLAQTGTFINEYAANNYEFHFQPLPPSGGSPTGSTGQIDISFNFTIPINLFIQA